MWAGYAHALVLQVIDWGGSHVELWLATSWTQRSLAEMQSIFCDLSCLRAVHLSVLTGSRRAAGLILKSLSRVLVRALIDTVVSAEQPLPFESVLACA